MGVPESIDTDEHRVGGGADGEGAIRIDNYRQESEFVGVVDNIVEAVASVVPEEWFTAFKIEASAAFAVEGIDRGNGLREIEMHRTASVQFAVPAPQVAAVAEDQSADERHGFTR